MLQWKLVFPALAKLKMFFTEMLENTLSLLQEIDTVPTAEGCTLSYRSLSSVIDNLPYIFLP